MPERAYERVGSAVRAIWLNPEPRTLVPPSATGGGRYRLNDE